MCTATLQLITFDFLTFPKVFSWSGPSVSGASTATNPTGAISQSSLQQTYTTAGSYNYSCTVSVSVSGDPTASTTDAISVIVTGKCREGVICTCTIEGLDCIADIGNSVSNVNE